MTKKTKHPRFWRAVAVSGIVLLCCLCDVAQATADTSTPKTRTYYIAAHKYNLELSQRRSASVKKALVERYHVDPDRLSTAGYGDSAPIDTNDTLEGRARNRRVELTLD